MNQKGTQRRSAEVDFRQLVESLDGYFFFQRDGDGEISYISPSVERILGYRQEEFAGPWGELLRGQPRAGVAGDGQAPIHIEARHVDGASIWLEVRLYPGNDAGRRPASCRGLAHDVSAAHRAGDKLKKLSHAVESSSSAIVITDKGGQIEYVNPGFARLTGFDQAETLGKNIASFDTGVGNPGFGGERLANGQSSDWKGELQFPRKQGDMVRVQVSISAVENDADESTHAIYIMDDISRQHELREHLSYQATHDSLTGLINRREFERRVMRVMEDTSPSRPQHALCFLDLDQFKVVNDTSGHIAGDELLRQIGQLMASMVRKRDTLARLGGDEFGILLEHCDLEHAQRLAGNLLARIQEFKFTWDQKAFRVGVSIGLVGISENFHNITDLLKFADEACYMAKERGRNRIHTYHPEDRELIQRQGEMQWVSRITKALDDNRFCLHAQPIRSLKSGADNHYEILIRMLDAKGGNIMPGAFLNAAERYNLIGRIDHWVVENVFAQLAANPLFVAGVDLVSINLSAASITDPQFLAFINSVLDGNAVPAAKICFEVTETVAISNFNSAQNFIAVLRERGCRFALDDFGSGLSSFGYLKNLPVDFLKIDGMFISNIANDKIDLAMVRSINEIGHVMGMETIAEFVESDSILRVLADIGLDYVQGYGIGKPEPFVGIIEKSSLQAQVQASSSG